MLCLSNGRAYKGLCRYHECSTILLISYVCSLFLCIIYPKASHYSVSYSSSYQCLVIVYVDALLAGISV